MHCPWECGSTCPTAVMVEVNLSNCAIWALMVMVVQVEFLPFATSLFWLLLLYFPLSRIRFDSLLSFGWKGLLPFSASYREKELEEQYYLVLVQ